MLKALRNFWKDEKIMREKLTQCNNLLHLQSQKEKLMEYSALKLRLRALHFLRAYGTRL